MLRLIGELTQPAPAVHHLRDVRHNGKRPVLVHIGVVVTRVGRQDEPADSRPDAHCLQPSGVTTNVMYRQARGDLRVAVMELHAPRVDVADHGHDFIDLVRMREKIDGHVAPRGVGQFAILQMKTRSWKQVEIANMIVMKMRDDDILDFCRIDPKQL